jgi:peptide methionine sulfoxide reductase MsrB
MAGGPLPRAGVCFLIRHITFGGDSTLTLGVQFRVLRLKGTEPAGTGEYEHNNTAGVYSCAACNTPLYKSTTKFNSGCGWPAFFDGNNLVCLSP